jgi:hypothetical protein
MSNYWLKIGELRKKYPLDKTINMHFTVEIFGRPPGTYPAVVTGWRGTLFEGKMIYGVLTDSKSHGKAMVLEKNIVAEIDN